MALTSVVLPDPFGPTSPNTSPRPIEIDTPFSAWTPPNRRLMSSHTRMGWWLLGVTVMFSPPAQFGTKGCRTAWRQWHIAPAPMARRRKRALKHHVLPGQRPLTVVNWLQSLLFVYDTRPLLFGKYENIRM